MLSTEAGCVFVGFILSFSGVLGGQNICALKGSSVDLPCSAEHPTSSLKWFIKRWNGSVVVPTEIPADGNHVSYNMSEENRPTLTIKDLTESDSNVYYCGKSTGIPEKCQKSTIELLVADLQVKVIPSTEGQTVTLMCNTSCPLTENHAAYIWYKNGEVLYQDWSPWYQELVGSEEAVRYSCAIKGYEDLRAPEVSVDSVTSACFNVTYAKGRMCLYKQTSEDEPCTITYPREINVQRSLEVRDHVKLTCNTSCPVAAFTWYKNGVLDKQVKEQPVLPNSSADRFSCAVKGLEDLRSAAVCLDDKNCWSVNYVSRRICALKGSSVNISSEYSHPNNQQPTSKSWYKINRSGKEETEELIDAAGRVKYHDNMKNHHSLKIQKLKKNDSAEYTFRLQKDRNKWEQSDFSGVTLIVTGLKVKFTPAKVTEGQRVTLTCSTSCPLNTNYIWSFNSRPLTLSETQSKHLVLDPVSSQHAGNYSCSVKAPQSISSPEKTLTVHSKTTEWAPAAAAGVCAPLLILIPLAVFWWIRRKRTSKQCLPTETSGNLEQQLNSGPVYAEISAQPTEQEDLHYSKVHFHQNSTDPLYSTVQPHPISQEPEHVPYAAVRFGPSTAPEHDGQAVDP